LPEVLPIDPQDADQVTSVVAENSRALFTITTGFVGTIWNAPGFDPESETVWGLLLALSAKDKVAFRAPDAVGLNATLAVQLAEAVRLAPHVFEEMMKSPGLVPVMLMLLNVIVDFVPFVNVAVCAALAEPTEAWKLRLVGDTVTLPLEVVPPVPVSATVCGLLLDASDTVRVAARDPVVVGLNVTLIVQLDDALRLLPHDLLGIWKSPAFVPVIAMLLIAIALALPLVNVAVCAVLVEPTLTLPKESDVGLMVAVPEPPVPRPERETVCGLLVAESLKLSVAVRVPLTNGPKVIFTVQLDDAPRLAPHVLLAI